MTDGKATQLLQMTDRQQVQGVDDWKAARVLLKVRWLRERQTEIDNCPRYVWNLFGPPLPNDLYSVLRVWLAGRMGILQMTDRQQTHSRWLTGSRHILDAWQAAADTVRWMAGSRSTDLDDWQAADTQVQSHDQWRNNWSESWSWMASLWNWILEASSMQMMMTQTEKNY